MSTFRVGYIGNLKLGTGMSKIGQAVNSLCMKCEEAHVGSLIITGGISSNYHVTLEFIKELRERLDIKGVALRYIIGNTDLYYPDDETAVDKEHKARQVLNLYRSDRAYLPTSPLNFHQVRILGAPTWYDYTLYRGKPVPLSEVTKKSKLWYRNRDARYITSPEDYQRGIADTFDTKYCRECLEQLDARLEGLESSYMNPTHAVLVTYFSPSKLPLKRGHLENYKGTFQGSSKLMDVVARHHITECVIGVPCRERASNLGNGLRAYNPGSRDILVREYQT